MLEVLIAVAILSTLLVSLIKSESETALLLEFTERYQRVQAHVQEELTKISMRGAPPSEGFSQGVFREDHPLVGFEWNREVVKENFLGFPVVKIIYGIKWNDEFKERIYEGTIFMPTG